MWTRAGAGGQCWGHMDRRLHPCVAVGGLRVAVSEHGGNGGWLDLGIPEVSPTSMIL